MCWRPMAKSAIVSSASTCVSPRGTTPVPPACAGARWRKAPSYRAPAHAYLKRDDPRTPRMRWRAIAACLPALLVRLERRAGADQVPVAVRLVDAADGGPVLAA